MITFIQLTNQLKQKLQKRRKHFFAVGIFFLLLGILKLFSFSYNESKEDTSYQAYFNANYKVFGLNIPKNLNFANEKVPISDFAVRESFDRELLVNTYWQSQTLLMHKRANRWLPIIEPILKRNGIPDDFKYLAVVESGLTNVVSPAKATGYWQLLESTGTFYGLEINEEVDERYNLEKSTEAACKYFKEAYQRFNNWTLVAASYNMGIGGIESQLKKQKVNNYYDLLLNEETGRYIFRILAVKEILMHPKDYGFILRRKDLYSFIPTNKITIDSSISDLADFAINQNINYKILKIFNPWLRKNFLQNKEKKTYTISIPKKEFLNQSFDEETQGTGIEAQSDSGNFFNINEILKDSLHQEIVHIVKEGETFASISKKYNIDEQSIKIWNMLSDEKPLKANQEIVILIDKKKK